jgi:aminoglycoside/choline kinase family phosphotransferase
MDAPNHRYCLLLEDLGSLRIADQIGSCSSDDALLVVRELARIHAAHWNDESALGHEWLPGLGLMSMLNQMIYVGGWEKFWAHLGPSLPPEFEAVGAAIGPAIGGLLAMVEEQGRTLVHGDYRLENFMFSDDGGLIVLDWQIAHSGGGAQDLAYFISQNLTVEARRELEGRLIDTYRDGLVAGGVAGYTREQLARDYRAGLLIAMAIPVNGVRAMDEIMESGGGDLTPDERDLLDRALKSAEALVTTMTERNVAAIFDNDAHLLLQELALSNASNS